MDSKTAQGNSSAVSGSERISEVDLPGIETNPGSGTEGKSIPLLIRIANQLVNLDAQPRRRVKSSLGKADETVDLRLRSADNWLPVAVQPDPLESI